MFKIEIKFSSKYIIHLECRKLIQLLVPQDAGVRQRVLHLVREKGDAAGCPKEKILSKKCKEDKKNKKHEGGHGE